MSSFPEPLQWTGDEPDPGAHEDRPDETCPHCGDVGDHHCTEICDDTECPDCVCQGCGYRNNCVCDELERDHEYERAAAHARETDFEETNGKDWT